MVVFQDHTVCIVATPRYSENTSNMTLVARQRLQALSQQLVEGIPSEGTFEDISRIRHVAGDSTGPRVNGKVVIVTGIEKNEAARVTESYILYRYQ